MFEKGDLVVYGNTGVCEVTEINTKDIPGVENAKLYYILNPVFDKSTIFAPVDGGKISMRKIMTSKEADALIDMIPTLKVTTFHSSTINELTQHYKDYFTSHESEDLIKVTMSIYSKREGGKFGAIDKRFMKQAENLLFGELSVALGISIEDVPSYIEGRVGDAMDGGTKKK